ncbi:hypothetical protein BVV10_01380 [Xanthomonas oryzae pv. oryzae]|nr:hypothetical protein BVV16_01380 [Xanthomonas oryzae pv. oryzae]AUI92873.1 hypothetical protein BVV17_01380 [Xanthomonas oryzae pv. oryzae]AUI96546.1 hypothetical protein BVV18_01385 [Xanthomonas oryzae pv. oryzae]AUJ00217.1 hypothetical protein BVV10_01380 [Xanthomonas oryzae pv. oryzae]AUJ03896.1 hypothetical protein BVV19_01385 [Xanthomonas oryzae pv. oryzae]
MDASSFRTNSVSHLWCVVQRFPKDLAGPARTPRRCAADVRPGYSCVSGRRAGYRQAVRGAVRLVLRGGA